MSELVIVKDEGLIRIVRMNRPDKKNALTQEMYAAMADALEEAGRSEAIRCVVLAGAPGAFCAGNDLQDFLKAATGESGLGQTTLRFLHALGEAKKPMVAAAQGVAVGIGTTMLLHCDYVVLGADARLATPFVALGLVPEAASSLIAPRLMGYPRAFSLLVMGKPLDAEAARAAGIANVVVPPSEAEAEAMKAAHEIAVLPAQAVAASRALMRGDGAEIIKRIDEEGEHYRQRLKSPEARAALEAFFARKR